MPFAIIAIVVIGVVAATGFAFSRTNHTPDATEPVAVATETPVTDTPEATPTDASAPATETTTDDQETSAPPKEPIASADTTIDTPAVDANVSNTVTTAPATMYADGSYAEMATYVNPVGVEHEITVELTLKNDVVTAADVLYNGETTPTDPNHKRFDDAYQAEVVGKALEDIDLSRTGGASLTTGAFNVALAEIKADATN